ncbi:MAG: AAA family ATPase [Asgard group archaeon]|nr:AAA family ATPase [Asgard group archaeon]
MSISYLAITGAQGSGKSIFTEIVKRNYDIPTFRMGEVIIEECRKRNLKITGRNMSKMASILRYEGGNQAIAVKSIPKIKKLAQKETTLLIIDGVRSFSELTTFRRELGEVRLIGIISSLATRKRRIEKRKRMDAESYGDFEEREERELSFGIGNVLTKADYFILNEGITKKEFIERIKQLLEKILQEKEK